MLISVNIGEEEYSLKFKQQSHPSPHGRKWRGSVEELEGKPEITFIEVNGEPTNIKVPPQITTSRVTLEERIKIALEGEREIENDGFENTEAEDPVKEPLDVIVNPYNPDEIKVRRDVFTITDIYNKLKRGDIDLNPDFQRHFVWEDMRKSRLIESVLLGIPLPVFYFSQDHDGTYHVVDGLQRLSTIRDFFDNAFPLSKLEHLSNQCDKKYYQVGIKRTKNGSELIDVGNVKDEQALERRFQRRFEDTQLNINIIEASSPTKVKYDIFRRINEGGRPLNQQEIRNCLAKNHTRKFMQELAKSEEFQRATDGSVSDQRMGAQEMVLRFAGFYLLRRGKLIYSGKMNDFLDNTLEYINKLTEKDLLPIQQNFILAMNNCYYLFGKYCFRKYLPRQLLQTNRQLINKSFYVTWSTVASDYSTELLKLKIKSGELAEILAQALQNDEEYWRVVTTATSDKKNVETAFSKTELLTKRYLE